MYLSMNSDHLYRVAIFGFVVSRIVQSKFRSRTDFSFQLSIFHADLFWRSTDVIQVSG